MAEGDVAEVGRAEAAAQKSLSRQEANLQHQGNFPKIISKISNRVYHKFNSPQVSKQIKMA